MFSSMTVRDSILTGAYHLGRSGFLANAFRHPSVRVEEFFLERRLNSILDLLGLNDAAAELAISLPFGTQRRVELARALIGQPKLLLLDEPASGLNRTEVNGFAELLRRIQALAPLSILLIEHDMALVMRLSDKVVALESGRCIAEGAPDQVQRTPDVIRAYLGVDANADGRA
jgi:branched-chain amino acid transport system ATP-binding protein